MRKSGSMTKWSYAVLVVGMLVLSGLGHVWAKDPKILRVAEGAGKAPHAIIKTKFGEMEVVFFPELAPKHVKSFLSLARKGFFNGTIIHRVIPGFMIQGGDPNTKDPSKIRNYGTGGPGYTLSLIHI